MKRLVTTLIATIFLCGWLPAVQAQKQQLAASLVGVTVEINQYGVLTALKDDQGNDFFGKGSAPLFDGYALAYYGANVQTGQRELRIVFANSRQVSKELLLAKPSAKPRSALVQTSDGLIEIVTEYKVSPETGELNVARRIKNLSKQPVEIVAIEEKKDERLAPSKTSPRRPRKENPGHFPYSILLEDPRACGDWICPERILGPESLLDRGWIDPRPDSIVSLSLDKEQPAFESSEVASVPLQQHQRAGNVTVLSWHRGAAKGLRTPLRPSGTSCASKTLFAGHQLAKPAHQHK